MNGSTDTHTLVGMIPAWVNLDVLVEETGGAHDVEYRKDYGPTGRLLVDALARWVKSMLDVVHQPNLSIIEDEDARDAITGALGFDDLDHVTSLSLEIYESLVRAGHGDGRYDTWTDGPGPREQIWAVRDPLGWFEMRLDPVAAIDYVARFVTDAGGVITWPEGDARSEAPN